MRYLDQVNFIDYSQVCLYIYKYISKYYAALFCISISNKLHLFHIYLLSGTDWVLLPCYGNPKASSVKALYIIVI